LLAQGHLCAVCADGYAYQGIYCKQCQDGQRFQDWPVAQRAGMILVGIALLLLLLFVLFFLPLCPRVEELLDELLQPAVESMERALGTMTAATRPRPSGPSRPMSAARSRPTSPARATSPARVPRLTDDPPRLSYLARTRRTSLSLMRRRSQSIAAMADGGAAGVNGGGGQPGANEYANSAPILERPSRVRVFFDLIAEPIRSELRASVACVRVCLQPRYAAVPLTRGASDASRTCSRRLLLAGREQLQRQPLCAVGAPARLSARARCVTVATDANAVSPFVVS
jgi:hypothetical protein